MPAFHVARSIDIQRSPEDVFDFVANYRTWTTWSPWLCIEKDANVDVQGEGAAVGSIYSWQGELVGAGEIEHLNVQRPSAIEDEIRFTKPFKSQSKVRFTLEPIEGGTNLTWHMEGNLPWFLFWMRSDMETFLAMDYDRGLKMIRDQLEKGAVHSDVQILGVEPIPDLDVCGVHDSCSMKDVGPAMGNAFDKASSTLESDGIPTSGEMISVYHPVKLKHGRFDFTSGYTVDKTALGSAANGLAGLSQIHLPAGQALHIRHVGSYDHLGNAWSGAHQYARYKKLKLAKGNAYEIYRNDPAETPDAERITDIYIPLR
jgi:effector-binding domain-containing protein/uncharacterized protein YndB with AHSA1/START domain